MNLPYSIPQQKNRSFLWLLAVVVGIVFLWLALLQPSVSPRLASLTIPYHTYSGDTISTSPVSPEIVPVQTPTQSRPSQPSRMSATPVPAGIQPNIVPQPVATPPSGN